MMSSSCQSAEALIPTEAGHPAHFNKAKGFFPPRRVGESMDNAWCATWQSKSTPIHRHCVQYESTHDMLSFSGKHQAWRMRAAVFGWVKTGCLVRSKYCTFSRPAAARRLTDALSKPLSAFAGSQSRPCTNGSEKRRETLFWSILHSYLP